MNGVRVGAIGGDVLRLFDGESTAGLGDGPLLDRFAGRRDESAFEALVARHGPMVWGVCRRMLADPNDADDAFQATFLVLAKKAGSIGDGDRLGPWLHGVAVRVARRARALAARRATRERLGVVPDSGGPDDHRAEWAEVRARIDEEIGRLPESQRQPVVLCDIEGLGRDEAAARLGWTPNMVRGRLERARARLRDRLTRQGLSPSGAWIVLASPPVPPKAALVAATARVALTAANLATGPAVILSRGVLTMMMLSKWKLAATTAMAAGAVVAGSGLIAAQQGPGADKPQAPAVPVAAPAKADGPADSKPRRRTSTELIRARVEAAKDRFDTQMSLFKNAMITGNHVIGASIALMEAERDASPDKAGRVAALEAHVERIREGLTVEDARRESGRSTVGDVAEFKTSLLDAEFALAKEIEAPEVPPAAPSPKPVQEAKAATPPTPDAASSLNVLDAIIRQQMVDGLRYFREKFDRDFAAFPGKDVDLRLILLDSSDLMGYDRALADSTEGRARAVAAHVDRLRKIASKVEDAAKRGEMTPQFVDWARSAVKDAEADQADEARGFLPATPRVEAPPGPGDPAGLGRARVASADRRLASATKEFREGPADQPGYSIGPFLKASRDLMDAELDAAGSRADRIEAIRRHLNRIAEASRFPAFVGAIRDAKLGSPEVDKAREEVLDARFRLARESSTPDPTGPAVVPSPGGSIPTTRPGPPSEAKPRSPLGRAVDAFNARWAADPVGREQPPLTEDEVIAAVRFWQPGRETAQFAKGLRTHLTPGDAPIVEFKAIAETGRLPRGATFNLARNIDLGEDYLYHGWWISILLPKGNGQSHPFPIRERLIRTVPLEEAIAREEATLQDLGDAPPADRAILIEAIKNWKERIAWRDKKARR